MDSDDKATLQALEQELLEASRTTVEHINPQFIDTKASTIIREDIQNAIKARLYLRDKHKLTQKSAELHISSHAPILDVWLCDVHLGSGDTDHDRFQRDFEYIRDTPGVYCTLGSNLIDNAIPGKFPDGMLQNVIPPEEQVVMMRQYVQELDKHGKVLAAITSPCHEGWTWAKAGQDINRLLFDYEGRQFPILENGSRLDILLNGIKYREALYHQIGPFNSNLNKSNGTQRMRQLQHSTADIVKKAHHHTAEAMMNFCDKGDEMRPVAYISGGCYKLDDQWAGGKGYVKGEPGGQAISLYHDKKCVQTYLDLGTALEHHKALGLLYWLQEKQRKLPL